MGANLSLNQDEPIAEINIVPFVDIILVVLIIFMVTTPLIMRPSISVDLPKAASGEKTTPSPFQITINANGSLFLNGKELDKERLTMVAQKTHDESPETQAIISADKNVSHGQVVTVIDIIRESGIRKFAITIDKN